MTIILSTLKELSHFCKSGSQDKSLYHTYGRAIAIAKTNNNARYLRIADRTILDGYDILLAGDPKSYPEIKPGDIVRFHRLIINKRLSVPECTSARNVLLWTGFKKEPQVISVARTYSHDEPDDRIRKELEEEYYHSLNKISEFATNPIRQKIYINIAGCIVEKVANYDKYGNIILRIVDGTKVNGNHINNYLIINSALKLPSFIKDHSINVIIYSKQDADKANVETSEHHEAALKLSVGDYVHISRVNACMKDERYCFHLSASHNGRTLSHVEPDSTLGKKIQEKIEKNFPNLSNAISEEASRDENVFTGGNLSSFSEEHIGDDDNLAGFVPPSQPTKATKDKNLSVPVVRTSELITTKPHVPPSKKRKPEDSINSLDTIAPLSQEKFRFVNIVARVVAANHTLRYGNHVLLLEDNTEFDYRCFHFNEILSSDSTPIDEKNKATLLVYNNNYPQESDKHINVARRIKIGDYVHIKNAKSSWRDGKLKLEINANLDHGKSLKIIDSFSKLAQELNLDTQPEFDECNLQASQFDPVDQN